MSINKITSIFLNKKERKISAQHTDSVAITEDNIKLKLEDYEAVKTQVVQDLSEICDYALVKQIIDPKLFSKRTSSKINSFCELITFLERYNLLFHNDVSILKDLFDLFGFMKSKKTFELLEQYIRKYDVEKLKCCEYEGQMEKRVLLCEKSTSKGNFTHMRELIS